jgi:hypothetical protein
MRFMPAVKTAKHGGWKQRVAAEAHGSKPAHLNGVASANASWSDVRRLPCNCPKCKREGQAKREKV